MHAPLNGTIWCVLIVLLSSQFCQAQPEPRPDPLDPTYEHDRWRTEPRDEVRDFRAFTTSFDSMMATETATFGAYLNGFHTSFARDWTGRNLNRGPIPG
jgi:hypothetical protein